MEHGLTHQLGPATAARPLIVLHERHMYNFNSLHPSDKRRVEDWKANKLLYTTPRGMNDDWFWLYAGVAGTQGNRSSIIVSNDQMRDHHFKMLSLKHFLKWRERHWVNFEFFDRDFRTAPTFKFPTSYSIRLQLLGGRAADAPAAWGFPLNDLAEPAEEDGGRPADGEYTKRWLCWTFGKPGDGTAGPTPA